MKKVWKFLTSMKFAIILLVILSLAMAGGSFIPQNLSFDEYAAEYSERAAAAILALRLDDVFHSWWFLALFILLCLDILICNLLKFPALLRRVKAAETRKAGIFGPFVSHLGMLLLIIGFVLGQITHQECTVYGYAGETKEVCDTGIHVTIKDFRVTFNADDSVDQYTVDLLADAGQKTESGTAYVNHPVKLFGYKFYQNSFGYTAVAHVAKKGETVEDILQEGRIYAGTGFHFQDNENITVVFHAFYPDYVYVEGSGPATRSGVIRNPGYLYSVYYNDTMLGMNVLLQGEKITIDDYEVSFDDPGYYTVLQVKKDSFTWLALLGGIILFAGLFLSFYMRPQAKAEERPEEKPAAERSQEEQPEEEQPTEAEDVSGAGSVSKTEDQENQGKTGEED